MSQITILGFTSEQAISPTKGANAVHWSILLAPLSSSHSGSNSHMHTRPKFKSLFSSQKLQSTSPEVSTLYDMHNHHLRQQEYPVVVRSSSVGTTTTTNISSELPGKPYTPSLRVQLTSHHISATKLAPKFLSLLQRTPTYGSEEDWLRAALDMLVGGGIFDSATSFSADNILAFIGSAVKEHLDKPDQKLSSNHEILDLDYAKHLREMAAVRAMFSRGADAATTVTPISRPAYATRSSSHNYFAISQKNQRGTESSSGKSHTFLGFRLDASPHAHVSSRQACPAMEKRAYYMRRDDPYGGLM